MPGTRNLATNSGLVRPWFLEENDTTTSRPAYFLNSKTYHLYSQISVALTLRQ